MDTIISKGKFQPGQGVLVAIITIGLFLFSRFLFLNAFSYQYLQIDHLIAAIVFTLVFLYFIFKGFEEYKAINIYESHLKIKWLFGLISVRLDKSVLRQFGQTSVKKIDFIYLKSNKFDILLNESLIENNIELIEQLREWQIKRKDNLHLNQITKAETKIGGIALMIAGLFMFVGILFGSYIIPITVPETNTLTTVSGHLIGQPEVKKPSLRSFSTNVIFKLQEYTSISFEAGNPGYNAIDINKLLQYKQGDYITLIVTKNEFEKKIKQEAEPTFNEKHFNWSKVHTYDIEINQQKVLKVEDFNQQALDLKRSNQKWGIFAICLAALVFWGGLKAFR